VRPRQILLDATGRPVLTDGGLAQAFAQAGLALSDVQAEAAAYLAPENAAGALPTQAGDIYALGVVFYRMLTGRVPFDAPSALALAARHRNDAPMPPSQLKANLAPTWDALALRLLAKNPAERPDAARLQHWITEAATVQTKPAKPAPAKKNGSAAVPVATAPVAVAPVVEPTTNVSSTKDFVDPTDAAVAASSTSVPIINPSTVAAVPVAAAIPAIPVTAPAAVAAVPVAAVPVAAAAVPAAAASAIAAPPTKASFGRCGGAAHGGSGRGSAHSRFKNRQTSSSSPRILGRVARVILAHCPGRSGRWQRGGAYTLWIDNTPKEVTVPAYLNKSQREAQKILAKRGLMLRIVRETYDPRLPAGTIVAGEPEPGRLVRARREVLATVSAGEAPIKMVDFEKITLPQARQIIVKHGLRLGPIVQQFHDTVPNGFICGQFPEPNEPLRRSEPITLIVSRGRQPTDIDATTGTGLVAQNESEPVAAPVVADDGFEPLEPANGIAPTSSGLVKRRATVRVQVPAGGSQIVRLMVRDAGGERTVYQRVHGGGERISQIVSVERREGETALVRVYVGEELIKEEQL
jgi:serine/threonine-protein kinase